MCENIDTPKEENKGSDIESEDSLAKNDEQALNQSEPEGKKPKDCRDNCMHCGFHCIYLKKEQR